MEEDAPGSDGTDLVEGHSVAVVVFVILVTLAGFGIGITVAGSDALDDETPVRPALVEDGTDAGTGPNDGAVGNSTTDESNASEDRRVESDGADDPSSDR